MHLGQLRGARRDQRAPKEAEVVIRVELKIEVEPPLHHPDSMTRAEQQGSVLARHRAVLRVSIALALSLSGCGGSLAGIVPLGFEERIELARQSLVGNWDNGPIPPTFTFRQLRCRADGGLLVLFQQQGFGDDGTAFAMQGGGALANAWAGGFAPIDPVNDREIVAFFREKPEAVCPG